MATGDCSAEIKTLARSYSNKVAEEMPDDPICQALGAWEEQERTQETLAHSWSLWLKFDAPPSDPESALLEKHCQEASETWRVFKTYFPELAWNDGIDQLPSVSSLYEEVSNAEAKWQGQKEKGLGKAKDSFLTFLESLDGHKALFSVFPRGTMYTSLFVGVISSIVKASTNHQKTADGFSEALANISCDIRFVRSSTKISSSSEMKQAVTKLYIDVFQFLCHAMKWYQSKPRRFRASFNAGFYTKEVDERVKKIQRHVKQVMREAQLETQMRVKDLAERGRSAADELRGHLSEMIDAKFEDLSQILQHLLGQSAANLLQVSGQATLEGARQAAIAGTFQARTLRAESRGEEDVGADVSMASTSLCTRDEIDELAAILRDRAKLQPMSWLQVPGNPSPPSMPEEVVFSLRFWLESSDSRFLWVEGPSEDLGSTELPRMGMEICEASATARIPTISYFRKPSSVTTSARVDDLVGLYYSLILQLVNLLPETLERAEHLSGERFAALDGTLRSIGVAQEMLDSLLALAPPSLVWVLDGLERLEASDTMADIARLINLLRKHGGNRRLKVLFTTVGGSYVLGKKLQVEERVQAIRLGRRSGSPLPGASSVGRFGLGFL